MLTCGDKALPPLLAVVTDAGNASKEQGNFIIKEAVSTMMSFWGAPFRSVQVIACLRCSFCQTDPVSVLVEASRVKPQQRQNQSASGSA